jgi:tetratricopeptide (TPR) repeat protein
MRLGHRATAAVAAAVAVAATAAYLPSLAGVFHFDDYNVIVNYPTVHSWGALFERAGAGVRPVLKASYALNWTLGFGFHGLNIALHAMNAVLLFFIGKELFKNQDAAFVAALLFALHPAQTEAVTYISGRSSSLMAPFYLGAMFAYLRGAHWSVSSLLFVLAVATRETAVTLPAALLLCELCRAERPGWKEILRRQGPHWALLLAGGFFLLANQRYFDLVAYGFTERSLADNLLTQVGGVSYLVLRLLSLHGYNIDPALPTLTEWTPALGFQAVLFALLLLLGLANLRARPWIAFGVLWFFLQLAPTNSIVPRLDVANDRQLYLASWGLFLAVSVQFSRIQLSRRKNVAIASIVVTMFLATSILRQLDYRSEIALWESSVAAAPWNARGHNNLGYAYQLAGRTQEARREYEAALLFDPRHAKARLNLLFLPLDRSQESVPRAGR